MIRENVRPQDINIKGDLMGKLGSAEREIIGCTIIIISRNNDNQWLDFTWEEYQERCSHKVSSPEQRYLDNFVKEGLLSCTDGIYRIEDAFIAKLWDLVKQPT